MTTFWIIAGLLIAGALVIVVSSLSGVRNRRNRAATRQEANISIFRDQMQELDADLAAGTLSRDQYDQAQRELESRVLEDTASGDATDVSRSSAGRLIPLVVGVGVPVLAVTLYLLLGNPRGLEPQQPPPAAAAAPGQAHDVTAQQITEMVAGLAAKLQQDPSNPQGWIMLARSYNVLQRFAEAAQAYEKALALMPGNSQVLADYADALGMVQGGDMTGKPTVLVAQSLKADPNNIKALALAGTIEFEKANYAVAVDHWQKAASLLPADSEFARGLQGSIVEARQKGGLAPVEPIAGVNAVGGASISGTVSLAPELAGKVAPSDTVFIFARASSGPRMPLAIVRKQVKDLPVSFALDDSMAMAPTMKLSLFPQVVVGARVSKSGNATPKPGDLESTVQPAALGASGLALVIQSEVK
jgi:cytochrome c-type biogenesis protein CcmH